MPDNSSPTRKSAFGPILAAVALGATATTIVAGSRSQEAIDGFSKCIEEAGPKVGAVDKAVCTGAGLGAGAVGVVKNVIGVKEGPPPIQRTSP